MKPSVSATYRLLMHNMWESDNYRFSTLQDLAFTKGKMFHRHSLKLLKMLN